MIHNSHEEAVLIHLVCSWSTSSRSQKCPRVGMLASHCSLLTNTLKIYILGQSRDWVRKYKLTSRTTQRDCLLKQLLHPSVYWALAVCQASRQISALILSYWIPKALWYHPYMQIITTLIMQRFLHLGRTLRDLLAQCPIQQNFLLQSPRRLCNLCLNTSPPLVALSDIVACFWPRRVLCFMIDLGSKVRNANQHQQVPCCLLF